MTIPSPADKWVAPKTAFFPGLFFANNLREPVWSAYGRDKRFYDWWHKGKSLFYHPKVILNAWLMHSWPNLRAELELGPDVAVLADSGGFQIFRETVLKKKPPKLDARTVLTWQERNADTAFIVDWPAGADQSIEDFELCLQETTKNAQIVQDEMRRDDMRMLRVLHGHTRDRIYRWYEALEPFTFRGKTGWSVGFHPSSDVFGQARMWSFLYDQGFRGYFHFLGVAGFNVLPLMVYVAQFMDEVVFDSSSYAVGYQHRIYMMPHDLDQGGEMHFGDRVQSHHYLDLPPCTCPACSFVMELGLPWWQVASDNPLGNHLIGLHNLWLYRTKHEQLKSLVQDRSRFFRYVHDHCSSEAYLALEYVDEVRRVGFDAATAEYARWFKRTTPNTFESDFGKVFSTNGSRPQRPPRVHIEGALPRMNQAGGTAIQSVDMTVPAWCQPEEALVALRARLQPVVAADLEVVPVVATLPSLLPPPMPEPVDTLLEVKQAFEPVAVPATGGRCPEKCPQKVSADLDLNFRIKHTRWPDVWVWLDHLWATSFHHGTELAVSLGTPKYGKPGDTDNVAWADRLLRSMVEYGWIKRYPKATPCLTRRAVGDLGGGKIDEKSPYMLDYGFEPNRDHHELRAFLNIDVSSEPGSYAVPPRVPLIVEIPTALSQMREVLERDEVRALPPPPTEELPVEEPKVVGGAEWSVDRRYRWWLWRELDAANKQCVLFIMLNPSTADALTNDPTMRRCIDFARRWGCGRLEVVNLFALSSPNPDELIGAADRVGSENDRWIAEAVQRADRLVCAWGQWGAHKALCDRVEAVLGQIGHLPLWSIGKLTKGGQPPHPLMLKATLPLLPFQPSTGVPSHGAAMVSNVPGAGVLLPSLDEGSEPVVPSVLGGDSAAKRKAGKPASRQLLVLPNDGEQVRVLGAVEDVPACFGEYEADVCDGQFCGDHFSRCRVQS